MKISWNKIFIVLVVLLPLTGLMGSEIGPASMTMTHRMMMLMLQLGIILFAARLGNLLFERLNMPGVLGELSAGIFIGPYILGGISLPLFPNGIFPVFTAEFPVSPELYGVCTLASIVLLFMIGLETDLKLFLRYSVVGSLVGIGGVIFSFLLGDLSAVLFSKLLFGVHHGFFAPSSLFLGIISTATSVGITARILSEQNHLDSPEGVTILAGAVIDDVIGIVLLAIGLGIISASQHSGSVDWGHIGIIAAKAIGIWLAATAIGLIMSRKISILLKWFGDRSSIAMMSLGLALILAGMFEEAGLAMIIGAYIMGLSLSKTDINQVIMEKLNPIQAFLVPIFFTVMGMLVNVRLFASRSVLLFGIIYSLLAIVAKILGGGLPALLTNFNLRGALRIGVGMLPRGEVALIVAGIGLAAGILTPEIFGVGVLMTLLTTLAAPPVLIRLFRRPGSGVRKQQVAEEVTYVNFKFPSIQTAELILSKLLYLFDTEGFYVHTLSQRKELYQLRKDDIVIDIQRKDGLIQFDCSKIQVPYINTAMYEVLAEFEAMIKELRKPIDGVEIGRKLQEHVPDGLHRPDLSAYITRNVLKPNLSGRTKVEIIYELLNVLDQNGLIKDLKKAREAVMAREESMSTGIQFGIAIPHGRTDAVVKLVCAIGLKTGGINFDSIDGQPAKIIILTLSPESASAPHMQFMSMISQALNEEGRDLLLECKSSKQMYEALTKGGPRGRSGRRQRTGLFSQTDPSKNRKTD